MTVSSELNRKTYAGNGATTAFSTSPVIFYDTSDLTVYTTVDATGVSTTLTEGVDYTVSGGNGVAGTVTCTTAPASGSTLVIVRELPLTQETDFQNNDVSDAEVSETALDKLTLMIQQVSAAIGRALRLSDADVSGASTTVSGPTAGYFLRWKTPVTGGLESASIAGSGSIGIPVTVAEGGTGSTTAGAARAALLIETESTVASSATPDIWTGTGMSIDYTGTATATGFAAAPQAGARRTLVCAGAAVFTAGANMIIPGVASASNFTAAANARIEVLALSTTQFLLNVLKADGTAVVAPTPGCHGGRLTLTTAVPYTTSDVTGATTVYYTPAESNIVEYYDGSAWVTTTFSELSQATTDNTKSPAAVAADSCYDMLVWMDGSTLRCTRSVAWTSVTNRGTGAGTAEVEFLNGRLVNKFAVTNGPAAQRGLVVGSIRSNGSSQINDSVTLRDVANLYNEVERYMSRVDTTNTWTYTTATWRQANASASNELRAMTCWPKHAIEIFTYGLADNTAAANVAVGVGVDVTNANSAQTYGSSGGNTVPNAQVARYSAVPAVGSHRYTWLEISTATGTTTFYGDGGVTMLQSGIQGRVFA